MDAIRQHLEPILARQSPHVVHPRVEVMWDVPYDITQVTMRVGQTVETVPPEMVIRRVQSRERLMQREADDPFRYLCEPDEYRLIDLECARKRRANPGVPLLLWLSGGIRSAKTFCLSRRVSAVFWHIKDSWCWGVHETDTTSATIMQPLVHQFVPAEIRGIGSKQTTQAKKGVRAEDTTYFSYTPGTGFVGSQFYIKWDAHDWRGCADPATCTADKPCGNMIKAGGRFEFKFYKQDEGTMVGQKLTCALNDENVPPRFVKLEEDRLLQRSGDTRDPDFLAELDRIILKLEAGGRAEPHELALIYLGWQLISFTPKWGWTSTVNMIRLNARDYGHYDPRPMVELAMRERMAIERNPEQRAKLEAEFQVKPWNLGDIDSVPRFSQPVNKRWLIAYLPTWANPFGGNWVGLVDSMQGRSKEDMLITMFGVVTRNVTSALPYDPERHIVPWSRIAKFGTIYEMADPAPGKPWVIKWYHMDALGRKRVVQEWPCPDWSIEGHGKPDMWAVPSEGDRLNGDEGPAQKLPLDWGWSQWTRLVWQGRQRLAAKLREVFPDGHGIHTENIVLTWKEHESWAMEGEFVIPQRSMMDPRFAAAPVTHRNKQMTVLEAMRLEENKINFVEAYAGTVAGGVSFLRSCMSKDKDILGEPELACVPECENTQFAWGTYTLAKHKEDTTASDEACKDFVDPDRYFVTNNPRYVDARPEKGQGIVWGGYG